MFENCVNFSIGLPKSTRIWSITYVVLSLLISCYARPLVQVFNAGAMLMPGERYVWRIAFKNFLNSLRPRKISGNNIGKDYIGNVYFEIPADPSIGKRKATRWYDPAKGLDFHDPIPAEWESWLRMRRTEPPTEEEIAKNVALAKLKKENAAKIELKRLAEGGSLPVVPEKGQLSYPTYPEYQSSSNDPK